MWTIATHRPARGPNSGPTTIAPMIRISWSVRIPTAAIIVADDHEREEAARQLDVLGGARLDLLPDHRVRRQAPRRLLGRGRRPRRSGSRCPPSRSTPPCRSPARGDRTRSRWRPRGRRRPGSRRPPGAGPPARGRSGCTPTACSGEGRERGPTGGLAPRFSGEPRAASVQAVLTDYHVHLRPDDRESTPAEEFFTRCERRSLPASGRRGRHRGARGLRAHPPVRGRAGDLGAPVLARERARRPRRLLRVRALDRSAPGDRDGLRPRPRGPDRERDRCPRVRLRRRLGPFRRRRRGRRR